MIFSRMNSIGDDSYYIRLKDGKEDYIHFEGDNPNNPKKEVVYRVKQGAKGAGMWHKKKAEAFIKMSGANNLELVKVSDVLGKDESLN